METNAAILIVAPIFMPIIQQYGIDPVHFGVIMIVKFKYWYAHATIGR
jgi:C4-dicarboxylate transporter DctM subunit